MRKAVLLTAAAVTAFLISGQSAPADRFDHVVRQKFFAGLTGDGAALEEAMKTCEDILAENPNHPEAMVWHGTGLFQQSAAAFRIGQKERGAELFGKAVAEMDKAVQLAPDNIGVRVPRGATVLTASRFMPPDLGKPLLERGLADYEHVLKMQSEYFDKIGDHPRGELLFGLAEGWARSGDMERAASYFARIEKDLPGTVYAQRAVKWRETKSLAPNETGCVGCHVRK